MGAGPSFGNIVEDGWGLRYIEDPAPGQGVEGCTVGSWYSQSFGSWEEAEEETGINFMHRFSAWDDPREITEKEVVWWEAQANRVRSEDPNGERSFTWLVLWVTRWMRWSFDHCESPGICVG